MLRKTTLLFCSLLPFLSSLAQQGNPNEVMVQIIHADVLSTVQQGDGMVQRLLGNVELIQGDSKMYCDSAYFNTTANSIEAWGNVRINQPNTTVESDYLRYNGNNRTAFLKGNVVLVNGSDDLLADQLNYDLRTKVGRYTNGGTLHSQGTTVTSVNGVYNLKTNDARFSNDVYVVDPRYEVFSNDLGYNTKTKVVKFYGLSTVTNPQSVLVTKQGSYDTEKGIAVFTSRSSLKNKEQYLEADAIQYFEKQGIGKATGNVIAIDTIQQTTLYADAAFIDEGQGTLRAYGNPVMKKITGTDSLFIKADTFYSAPIPQASDTVAGVFVKRAGTNVLASDEPSNEAPQEDTARPRYFIGYHKVKIFSDSLQAVCDSIAYSQKDSTIRLMQTPIAWTRQAQITGETIHLLIDSSDIKMITVLGKSFIVSRSGPEVAQLYDQIKGDTLYGYFEEGQLRRMEVRPNGESIYYATDEAGAYLGVNQSESREIHVLFNEQKINKITLIKDVKQTMTPLKKADTGAMRLTGFTWEEAKRPKSVAELFER